jgi:aldehyde dehydrogenase (NAD+)
MHAGLWMDNQQHPAQDGRTFTVHNPQTGEVIGTAAYAGPADVDCAVQSAERGFADWATLRPSAREHTLLRAADLLDARANQLIPLLMAESGSTVRKARMEVTYSASMLRAAAGEARRLYGETIPHDTPERLSLVLREPLGVVASISPFNAPLALLVKMCAFPLAAGNAVISKPSELTPLIAVEFARLLAQAGLPAGAFNVLSGYGHDVGAALVEHPLIRGIAFTGSTAAGIRIGQMAMPTLKRLQLELGGKNALLVLRDFDPVQAAHIAVQGAFYHAGQICMSSARLIVERAIAPAFIEALAAAAEALHLGDLHDERTFYGPLISPQALDKVERHVEGACASGAQLLTGGYIVRRQTYAPTVLLHPALDSAVWCEETFGPVTSIVTVEDADEAVKLANASAYGLSAGILTRDIQIGLKAARAIRAGGVHIGMHSYQSEAMAPVGGYGLSGIGRSGGQYSTEHFTERKWVSIELGS